MRFTLKPVLPANPEQTPGSLVYTNEKNSDHRFYCKYA